MCPSRVPQQAQIASVISSMHVSFKAGLSKIVRPVVLPKQMSSSQAGAAWAQFCLRRVPSLFGRKQWSRIAARITWFACPPPLPRCDQQWFEQPRSDPVSALSERVWLQQPRARGRPHTNAAQSLQAGMGWDGVEGRMGPYTYAAVCQDAPAAQCRCDFQRYCAADVVLKDAHGLRAAVLLPA